jgi:hypothetical protein
LSSLSKRTRSWARARCHVGRRRTFLGNSSTGASGILLAAVALTTSCSSQGPEEASLGKARLEANGDGTTCVTIQRGALGSVEDATIRQSSAGWNDATSPLLRTGTSPSGGPRQSLIRFDMSPVPTGVMVLSATLRLYQTYREGDSTINLHRITSPWTEATVTWNSFGIGGNFDPAVAASFVASSGFGIRTVDVTSLAQGWLNGSVPSHGVLIEEANVLETSFRSSEHMSAADRPGLEVCFTACAPIDDHDACTIDSCEPVTGTLHTPVATDDGNPSTIDTCDPATGAVTHTACPALDATVTSRLIDTAQCLYQGPNAPQKGVTAAIDPISIAVIKGQVATRSGAPLPSVKVSVVGHGAGSAESYGHVFTRADGAFELVVRGGQPLTLQYEKAGYLPSQRQVTPEWQRWVAAPGVALIERDSAVTTVALGSAAEAQVVRGSAQADESGTRQATLIFPPNTSGTMTVPDLNGPPGATTMAPLPAEVHVRATEYTVGPNGPKAMPGSLPKASGYTYAVELGLDEAVAAGATQVQFNQPIPFYVDNFLDFPIGMAVPIGYYHHGEPGPAGSEPVAPLGRHHRSLAQRLGRARGLEPERTSRIRAQCVHPLSGRRLAAHGSADPSRPPPRGRRDTQEHRCRRRWRQRPVSVHRLALGGRSRAGRQRLFL